LPVTGLDQPHGVAVVEDPAAEGARFGHLVSVAMIAALVFGSTS
jgi:hypothetical protein